MEKLRKSWGSRRLFQRRHCRDFVREWAEEEEVAREEDRWTGPITTITVFCTCRTLFCTRRCRSTTSTAQPRFDLWPPARSTVSRRSIWPVATIRSSIPFPWKRLLWPLEDSCLTDRDSSSSSSSRGRRHRRGRALRLHRRAPWPRCGVVEIAPGMRGVRPAMDAMRQGRRARTPVPSAPLPMICAPLVVSGWLLLLKFVLVRDHVIFSKVFFFKLEVEFYDFKSQFLTWMTKIRIFNYFLTWKWNISTWKTNFWHSNWKLLTWMTKNHVFDYFFTWKWKFLTWKANFCLFFKLKMKYFDLKSQFLLGNWKLLTWMTKKSCFWSGDPNFWLFFNLKMKFFRLEKPIFDLQSVKFLTWTTKTVFLSQRP